MYKNPKGFAIKGGAEIAGVDNARVDNNGVIDSEFKL